MPEVGPGALTSGDRLTQPETLGLSSAAVGLVASVYLAGEVVGALFFGRLSDKLGRRNLFMITLGVYLVGSGLTAFTLGNSAGWIVFLYITRFIAGMGIGGEYAAINSAIDELIPARFRGRVDIAVNGTYWAGAILGTLGTFIFLKAIDLSLGWRLAFLHRPGPGTGDPAGAPQPAREPPLAGHERPRGRRREIDRLHRARGAKPAGSRSPPSTTARPSTCNPPRRSATWR